MPAIDGRVEAVLGRRVVGWAADADDPAKTVTVDVLVDGRPAVRGVVADVVREDLEDAGTSGRGFVALLPDDLDLGDGRIEVVPQEGSGPLRRDAGFYERRPGRPAGVEPDAGEGTPPEASRLSAPQPVRPPRPGSQRRRVAGPPPARRPAPVEDRKPATAAAAAAPPPTAPTPPPAPQPPPAVAPPPPAPGAPWGPASGEVVGGTTPGHPPYGYAPPPQDGRGWPGAPGSPYGAPPPPYGPPPYGPPGYGPPAALPVPYQPPGSPARMPYPGYVPATSSPYVGPIGARPRQDAPLRMTAVPGGGGVLDRVSVPGVIAAVVVAVLVGIILFENRDEPGTASTVAPAQVQPQPGGTVAAPAAALPLTITKSKAPRATRQGLPVVLDAVGGDVVIYEGCQRIVPDQTTRAIVDMLFPAGTNALLFLRPKIQTTVYGLTESRETVLGTARTLAARDAPALIDLSATPPGAQPSLRFDAGGPTTVCTVAR